MKMDRSPSTCISITARNDLPINRWISCVRPLGRPFVTSRGVRVLVARGSMEYSAVTHPLPELRRNEGTELSTLAAQSTRVSPTAISAEPSAVLRYPGVMVTGRNWFGCLESARIFHRKVHRKHDHEDDDYHDHQARSARPHLRSLILRFFLFDGFIFRHSELYAVTLLNVNRRRGTSSLLFVAALLAFGSAACGTGDASKPDLPTSVSPGWSLKKSDSSPPPATLPKTGNAPQCWTADYAGEGSATVQICGYHSNESAF